MPSMPSMNPLIRKLEAFTPLSDDDKRLLEAHTSRRRSVGAKQDVIGEGARPNNVHLVVEGFACRYKVLPDGGRQIMAYLVPGDFCDLHVFILKAMDHSIAALSPCEMVEIPPSAIIELTERPAVARALWWATLVDEAVLREWIVGLGRRPAEERLAHILCELLIRLDVVGLVEDGRYRLPITQNELADTLGLTPVHVNRMLQNLREQGVISLKSRELVVLDVERLKRISAFDPNYLHLDGAKAKENA